MVLTLYKENKEIPKTKIKHVIAIAAGKGGVGKSSVSVNLALALQNLGWRVGIFDADIYGPSVRKMLREDIPPSQREGRLIPAIGYGGIRLMSMAYFQKENDAAAIRAPIANGIIKQLIQNVEWGNLDCLFIDFPPGTGDIQLTLSQYGHLTGALMVTTPQDVALLDVKKAMDLFERVKIPIIGIVENMSYYLHGDSKEKIYIFGKGGGGKLAAHSQLPLLGKIPIDPEICRHGDSGEALIVSQNKNFSCGALSFIEVGKRLIEKLQEAENLIQDPLQEFELKLENTHFQLIWRNGEKRIGRLKDLQNLCPCAGCREESTAKKRSSLTNNKEVKALSFEKIGQYAVKIQFTSGCSLGLYDEKLLRQIAVFS